MADQSRPRIAWVTGSAGFIGGHVARRLRDDGWTVTGLDRSTVRTSDHIVGALSVSTLEAALKVSGPPQFIFHGAGTSLVGDSMRDPDASLRDTVVTTETLLAFMLEHMPWARMVYPSSAAVYGGTTDVTPIHEDRPANPMSVYGTHKVAAEKACIAAAEEGLSVGIMRLFSVYGPGLRKQLPWDLGQKLIAGKGRVELFGTGLETRDFLHVSDVAALVALLAGAKFSAPLIVNGGTGIATRVNAFASLFANLLDIKCEIAFNGTARAGDPQHYQADIGRLQTLGFVPQITLDDGLADYAAWIKAAQ
jgi:UDP-glucose 4-epimerase